MTLGLAELTAKIDSLTLNMMDSGAFFATEDDLSAFAAATDDFIRVLQQVTIQTPPTTTTQEGGAKIIPFRTPCTGERPC